MALWWPEMEMCPSQCQSMATHTTSCLGLFADHVSTLLNLSHFQICLLRQPMPPAPGTHRATSNTYRTSDSPTLSLQEAPAIFLSCPYTLQVDLMNGDLLKSCQRLRRLHKSYLNLFIVVRRCCPLLVPCFIPRTSLSFPNLSRKEITWFH